VRDRVPGLLLVVALGLSACAMSSRLRGQDLSFEELLARYRGLEPVRALAVARDPNGAWAYGVSDGNLSQKSATERALRECRRSAADAGIRADCRLYAIGDERVEPADGER
jgi:hypothetical protein